MSGTLDTVRVLVTEIRTESATAEVALWTISISVAAYVGAVVAGRRAPAHGDDALSAAHGWGAVRFAALVAVVITEGAGSVGLTVIAVVTAALVSWRRRSWAPGMLIVGTVVAADELVTGPIGRIRRGT